MGIAVDPSVSAKESIRARMDLKLESAGSISMTSVGQHFEATTINEIAVVTHSVEKVYFLTICFRLEHSFFSEVIRWTLPFKGLVD